MSFIHTCELNKVDPFHYLTQVLRNTAKINADRAANRMPWTYRGNDAVVPTPK